MIQYYYTKKEWGVVMEKEELKILEELRRILNSKNEAIVILNNYFKGAKRVASNLLSFSKVHERVNFGSNIKSNVPGIKSKLSVK